MSADLGSAYFQLVPSMAGFNRAVTSQLSGLGGAGTAAGRSLGGSFTAGFGSILGGSALAGVFGGVAAAATNAIGNAVGSAFKAAGSAVIGFNAQLQNSTIGFESVLGSSKKATAFVGELQKFAANTPFEFQDLVKYAQTLTGFGVSAKKVIPTLTALGDAVANAGGSSDQLNGAVLAYSQLAAKQKVDLGNILQLQNAGIPALKYLAAAYHTNVGAIQDQISAGKILSAEALPALNKAIEQGAGSAPALGGAMDKLSMTFTGAASNIKDNATQLIAKAFKPLFDSATKTLQGIATALGSPAFKTFASNFATQLQTVVNKLGALKATAATVAKFLFTGQFAGSKNFFGLEEDSSIVTFLFSIRDAAITVGKAVSTAFSGIGPSFISAVTSLSPLNVALQQFAPTLPVVSASVSVLATAIGTTLSTAVKALVPALVSVSATLASAFVQVLPSVVSVFGSLALTIGQLAPKIGELIVAVAPLVAQLVAQLAPVLVQLAQQLLPAVGSTLIALLPAITSILDAAAQLAPVLNAIIPIVVGIISVVANLVAGNAALINIFAQLSQGADVSTLALKALHGGFGPVIQIMTTFAQVVGYNIGTVVRLFTQLPRQAIAALGDTRHTLFESGVAIIQGFINGIGSMIGNVRGAVSNIMSAVADFFPQSPAKTGPFSGRGWTQVRKSGQALFGQLSGGFNDGVTDFGSRLSSVVPDTFTSSVAGTITNATRGGTAVLINNKTNVRLEDLIDVRVAKNSAEETRAQRLGYQPVVLA